MNDYFLIYKRTEEIKYVSHLDFVRVFGRAFRRAELPIAYSEGFNPHPLLTFALPLSVGYTSECEILEFTFSQKEDTQYIKERLSAVLPVGIEIVSVYDGKTRMKALDIALYNVTPENMAESVDDFLKLKSILIEKKTKSGIKETDIRADIKDIKLCGNYMEMILSAGSRKNLKPEVVINAMNKYIERYNSGDCEYHRVEIYDKEMKIIRERV